MEFRFDSLIIKHALRPFSTWLMGLTTEAVTIQRISIAAPSTRAEIIRLIRPMAVTCAKISSLTAKTTTMQSKSLMISKTANLSMGIFNHAFFHGYDLFSKIK